MVLETLATDADPAVRRALATNPACPDAAVRLLAADTDVGVRRGVARRRPLTLDLAELLTLDTAKEVRKLAWQGIADQPVKLVGLAVRPEAQALGSVDVLLRLIRTDARFTRLASAIADAKVRPRALRAAYVGVLDDDSAPALFADADSWGHYQLANNPTCPVPILHSIAQAAGPGAAETAAQAAIDALATRPEEHRWLLRHLRSKSAAAVAAQPGLDRFARLRLWARPPNAATSRNLARNPETPAWMIGMLSAHRRWDVRRAAVSHPQLADWRFRRRTGDRDWAVLAQMAVMDRTTPDDLFVFANRQLPPVQLAAATNPRTPRAAILPLTEYDRNRFVRAVALRHPSVLPDELRHNARHLDQPGWILRSIATNPSCPTDLADELLAWLALGGAGDTDPTFDPITCVGHPGSTTTAMHLAYRDLAAKGPVPAHPLWKVRQAYAMAADQRDANTLQLMARDPSTAVRRRAAQFGWAPTINELCEDEDAGVAQTAAWTRSNNKLNKPKPIRRIVFGTLGVLLCVGIVDDLFFDDHRDSPPTVSVVSAPEDIDQMFSASTPICQGTTFGGRVLVTRKPRGLIVTAAPNAPVNVAVLATTLGPGTPGPDLSALTATAASPVMLVFEQKTSRVTAQAADTNITIDYSTGTPVGRCS